MHKEKTKKIIVAVPVASSQIKTEIDRLVDETIVLTTPSGFQAVAQVYENWYDVPDEEVIALLDKWNVEHESK